MSELKAEGINNYATIFLLISVASIIYELISGSKLEGTWPCIIIMNIYYLSSKILDELEQVTHNNR